MIEVKNFSGGLNLDDSKDALPPNDYIYALNITHDAVEGNYDKDITNIVSNRSVPYEYPVFLEEDTSFITFLTSTNAQTEFSGEVSSGLVINVYLTEIATSEEVLIGTYTTVQDDTFDTIVDGLWASMQEIGIVTFVGPIGDTLFYHFLNTTYSFNRIDIIPDPTATICIGAYPNTLRNTVIYFIYSRNSHHLILEFNKTTRTIAKILENITDTGDEDILGFTEFQKITSINVFNREEGDLLFFLDSLGRPTGLDISLFKQGEYTPVTRAIIDKAKKPPLSPPSVIYDNDTTRRTNNLRNRLFRFKYRWIYDDFEKSTFSPISIVPLPASILSDVYTNVVTNNNVIRMVADTGDKNVKSVEIAMSYVEKTNDWSDFQSVQVVDKSTLGLTQTTVEDIGDTQTAEATTFAGNIYEGTVINIYLTQLPSTEVLAATYTTVAGDTLDDVAAGLASSMAGLAIVDTSYSYTSSVVYFFTNATYVFDRIDITPLYPDNDNIDFAFAFYNDSTYPVIDVEESIQLFDYVPQKANAQELLNGNILAYAGITEGYNKDTIANATITVGTIAAGEAGGPFNVTKTILADPSPNVQIVQYVLTGIPITGTVFEVKVKRASDHAILVASTYTSIAGDTVTTVTAALAANNAMSSEIGIYNGPTNLNVYVNRVIYEAISTVYYSDLVVTPPASSSVNNSIATFPFSEEISLARAYFDEKGVTNGILYTDRVSFPAYAENGSQQVLLPYINAKVNDVPPIWAYSMQWYLTKTGTTYIAWVTNSVNKSESEYIYFDVTNFNTNAAKTPATSTVLSYSFKDGDRVRIWRNTDSPGTVYDYTYDAAVEGLVVDPTINSTPQTGTFLKIKNIEPFTSGIDAGKNYVILIYTPTQQSANSSNQVYYEFGQQYYIIDPGTAERRHSGMVSDQEVGVTPAEFNFYEGDAYFRRRTITFGESGYVTYNAIDRNFVDIYTSAVNSVDGRPNLIDTNARQAYYPTLIRHGQAYQANTNINGLNRFYAKNFDEYDYSFGDVLRLVVKNRQVVVLQKYKIGTVPLYSSLGKDANGLQVVFQTDKLLNPIQYHAGDFGIGTCPESVASFNYAIYGCDNVKGVIWRFSTDGITPISILYKVNSWANRELVLRVGDYKIYGAFDQQLNKYITKLDAVEGSEEQTLVFDEESNRFGTFQSLFPEMMCTLGTTLCSFKNGIIWTHDVEGKYNNFFGVQYDSYITAVFNKAQIDKKTFMALEQIASQAWACPEIITSSNEYGSTKQTSNLIEEDFEEYEGDYNAAFLGASNSLGGLIDGSSLKGNNCTIKFRAIIPEPPNNNIVSLSSVTVKSIQSQLNVHQ